MLLFLFLPFSAYPKPRTAFREEREDDEDLMRHDVDVISPSSLIKDHTGDPMSFVPIFHNEYTRI
jgi:hypothetical protein